MRHESSLSLQRKPTERRLSISTPTIVDQATIKAGFEFREEDQLHS
jgi:hypothetical protein